MTRLLAALLLAVLPLSAFAQAWPTKPVRLIVPHPGGGGPLDLPARGLAERFGQALGQPFVVENRDGADGFIGTEAFVKSPADGYTFLFTSASVITMNELTRLKLPYNSARDLQPVAYAGTLQSLLVTHPSVGIGSLKELIAHAKANPDKITWGTLGTTSNGPLLIGLFRQDYGARFYMIPFKSNIQALQATVAGEVNMTAYAVGGTLGHVKAGKLRPMAYTGDARHPALPDVPTFNELGVKLGFRTWIGLFAHTATAKPIVDRLNAEAVKALSDDAFVRKYLSSIGVDGSGPLVKMAPEQFAKFIREDRVGYEAVVKAAGIQKR